MHHTQNDSARSHFGQVALKPQTVGAGVGGSGTEKDGTIIDRLAIPMARSAALHVFGTVTLTSGESLTVAANLQDDDASNMGGADDYGNPLAATVVVSAADGALTNQPFDVKLPVDLTGARQYIRSQQTFTLSKSGTDTAAVAALLVLGGLEHVPVASGY